MKVVKIPSKFSGLFDHYRYKAFYGGRGCVHGNTEIETPKGLVKIKDFIGGEILAYNHKGVEIVLAPPPIKYSAEQLFEVCFTSGKKIICTAKHKFLTYSGWRETSSISPGELLLVASSLQQSNSGISLHESVEDARHCFQRVLNFLYCCSVGFRQYDEQLLAEPKTYQDVFRKLAYGQGPKNHISIRLDGLESVHRDILLLSSRLLSSLNVPHDGEVQDYVVSGTYIESRTFEQCSLTRLGRLISQQNVSLDELIPEFCNCVLLAWGEFSSYQDKTLQELSDMLMRAVDDDSYSASSVNCNRNHHYTEVSSITRHSFDVYYDIFVPIYNNYIAGGVIHHNSAKSHSFATVIVLRGAQKTIRWLFAREIQNSLAASVKQLLEDKIHALGLSWAYKITDKQIIGINGTKFLFAGLRSNIDSIKSMEGLDGVWVEEADSCSQVSLDLLIPTIRKPGSEIWFSWNRRYARDPVDMLFLGGEPPPNSLVCNVNWQDNPFFTTIMRDEMLWLKSRDRDKWLHVWDGQLIQRSDSKIFKNWIVGDLDDKITQDTIPRLGADWGFSIDPTVLIECYVFDRTLYVSNEIYKVGCEIDETPSLFSGYDARKMKRWTNTFGHPGLSSVRCGYKIVADGARPETISYMKKRGFNIVKAKKGPGSIKEGVEFMKSYDIVIHPRCKHTIDEIGLYSYKVDRLTDEVVPQFQDDNNHVIDGIRYAIEGIRRSGKPKIALSKVRVVNSNV